MLYKRYAYIPLLSQTVLESNTSQANAFAPNWGQTIFQSASEMAQNTHIRERLGEIMSKSTEEKKWWESRKAMIQSDFMKELDEEKTKSSEDDAVLVDAGGPAGSVGKSAGKKVTKQ